MSAERVLLDNDQVAGWVDGIRRQVEPFLDFDGPVAATMVNNLDWTAPLCAIDFLRDVGKHFSVNRMLAKESVQARLNGERHQLHRVQLPAAAGQRLPRAAPPARLRAAVRRHRPVGQHHRGRRPRPPCGTGPGARLHHAAGHQGRRHQVRQDRGQRRLARPDHDQPVRLLPVLGQRRRPRRRPATCATSASAPARRSRSWRRRRRSDRRPGWRSGRSPRSSPPGARAPTSASGSCPPARRCSAGVS